MPRIIVKSVRDEMLVNARQYRHICFVKNTLANTGFVLLFIVIFNRWSSLSHTGNLFIIQSCLFNYDFQHRCYSNQKKSVKLLSQNNIAVCQQNINKTCQVIQLKG